MPSKRGGSSIRVERYVVWGCVGIVSVWSSADSVSVWSCVVGTRVARLLVEARDFKMLVLSISAYFLTCDPYFDEALAKRRASSIEQSKKQ